MDTHALPPKWHRPEAMGEAGVRGVRIQDLSPWVPAGGTEQGPGGRAQAQVPLRWRPSLPSSAGNVLQACPSFTRGPKQEPPGVGFLWPRTVGSEGFAPPAVLVTSRQVTCLVGAGPHYSLLRPPSQNSSLRLATLSPSCLSSVHRIDFTLIRWTP